METAKTGLIVPRGYKIGLTNQFFEYSILESKKSFFNFTLHLGPKSIYQLNKLNQLI